MQEAHSRAQLARQAAVRRYQSMHRIGLADAPSASL